jgi:hypothetical protein
VLPLLLTLIVVVAAAIAYTAWRSRFGPPAPGSETLRCTVVDVKQGGVLRLAGFGDDGEDMELPIATLATVRLGGGGEEWHELGGEYRKRRVRLEWRKRPNGPKVVAFSKTDMPLDEAQLDPAALEAARPGSGPLAALGGTFRVEEAGDAVRGEALALKTWLLVDDEKRRVLRVDRVGEQPPRACLGRVIAADAIDVIRTG